MRSHVGIGIAFALVCSACGCQPQGEEARLRARIDTTSVHLYVASKVAITKTDDPRVTAARNQLMAVFRAEGQSHADAGAGAGVRLRDGAALVRELWTLRQMGADIVRNDSEDELQPVLPVLLRPIAATQPIASQIDVPTDHFFFLSALVLLKFDEHSPAPIPMEILLYEAWKTHPDRLVWPGLAPLAHTERAWVFGANDFCDLAAADAAALDAGDRGARRAGMGTAFSALGASAIDDAEVAKTESALRALAHGQTGICYLKRRDTERAASELRRFVAAAEELGIPAEDLALPRAYLAYHDGDLAETRRQLALARQAPGVDEPTRRSIDELGGYLDRDDRRSFDAFFDGAFFASLTARLVLNELRHGQLADDARASAVLDAAQRFAGGVGRAIGGSRDVAHDLAQQSESFWDRFF